MSPLKSPFATRPLAVRPLSIRPLAIRPLSIRPLVTGPLVAFSATAFLAGGAHAQQQFSPFATGTPAPPSGPVSQRQFAEAANSQISFLGALRDWRDTFRGSGKAPRRELAPKSLGKQFGFALGSVAPPIVGTGAGIAARYSLLEVGSTAQPGELTDLMARYDSMVTGDKVAAGDQTQMTWMRARPIQNKNTDLELSMSRGRRDMQGGAGENWLSGNFQNARLRLNLPHKWALNSNLTREKLETQEETNMAWTVDANGPIAHPFGVATARVNITDVDAGFATLADPNAAVGQKKGEVEVAQDVKIGPVSGNLRLAANQRERAEDNAKTGEEIKAGGARTQAQMRLAVTPNLALISSGSAQFDNLTRALQDQTATPAPAATDQITGDALLPPSQARELNQQLTGDVGVEWKFSKALSVALSTGTTRGRGQRENGELWADAPGSDEDRHAVEVRHKTNAADLRVRLAQRARRELAGGNSSVAADISQWRIEASRRLIGSVHLRTIVDLASDDKTDQDWHQYEAQFQLARAARFDARYRDGTLAPGLLSNEWNSAFSAPDSSPRQWSARFNAGSTAAGNGLGLALEYARSVGSAPDMWRVGLQFK
jgi:hypothetical protein